MTDSIPSTATRPETANMGSGSERQPDRHVKLDTSLTTDATGWLELADSLMPQVRKSRDVYRQAMLTLLLNLCRAWAVSPEAVLRYSRRPEGYSPRGLYNRLGITFTSMVKCVDHLMDSGSAIGRRGFQDQTSGVKRRSWLRATPALLDRWMGLDLAEARQDRECIVLRDADGKDIPYQDTRTIKAMRRSVEWINTALEAADIRLGRGAWVGGGLDYTARSLQRIFNRGRFDLGGRFYGHWVQGLPHDQRRHLLINGEPVSELDFKGMAPSMLYLREGKPLPDDDIYGLPEQPGVERDMVKMALQVLLNAETHHAASLAIRQELADNKPALRWIELFLLPEIRQKHPFIAKYIGSGIGPSLQHDESRIAEGVLLALLNQGVTCIPIHDSFIVQARYADRLQAAMEHHCMRVMGGLIPIDRRY